jgi:septum formation protein
VYRFFYFILSMLQLPKPLILASSSPRRAQLLRQVGLSYQITITDVDEEYNGSEPIVFAKEMSYQKARNAALSTNYAILLAADTIVVLENRILGKPRDAAEAVKMLADLSGKRHEVITGYTLYDRPSNHSVTDYELTQVWFRDLDRDEIDAYVASGSPFDKAGGYGIQDDFGAVFINRIEGCYYNVVGLPLAKVYNDLKAYIQHPSIEKNKR